MNTGNQLCGALVGYGFIAERGHAPAYARQRDLRIVAVADTTPARRARAAADLPGARIYTDHQTMLEREAGRIGFVDIATPPSTHAPIATAALTRGLHVLCEKPIATTAAAARSLATLARAKRRVFFPSHNYKHAPVVRTLRRILDAGTVGRVHLATLQTFRTTHARGVDEWRPDWRRERAFSGGGIGMDHGPHTFYLAFDWLGGHPTSVTAKTSTTRGHDTEDDFHCTLTFPGGIAVASLTWNAGARKVIYTLHGDHGAIRVEDDDIETTVAGEPGTPPRHVRETVSSHWQDASHADWFVSLFGDFAAAIDQGEWIGREAEDAVRAIELIETAYASARRHSVEEPFARLRRAV